MRELSIILYLREIIFFLALAGILIPLLQRLRISPVLGFLAAGSLLGPYGLGAFAKTIPWVTYFSFPRIEGVFIFAEFGILFLMFMIGLELSASRLLSLKHWVFKAGALQVALTGSVIGIIAYLFNNSLESSVVLGVVLSLSSTAVVMQLLSHQKELGTPVGRATFAVLLFQDLVVIPLLFLVDILGTETKTDFVYLLGLSILKGVLAITVIYMIGRRLIRPFFRHFANQGQPDTFMALILLCTLGIAALTWGAGLSMALGAFLAGLLLSETEYRHEIEVMVEPFKGLLIGVFFVSVGMSIDWHALVRDPLWLPLSVIGLLCIKTIISTLVFKLFGLSTAQSVEGGFLLNQGGEFAFIVIGVAVINKLIDPLTAQFMMMVVGMSMLASPAFLKLGRKLGVGLGKYLKDTSKTDKASLPSELSGHVIIAGFGRIGQLVSQVLESQNISFVAVESDLNLVSAIRKTGIAVHHGDGTRIDLLKRLRIEQAAAVVITLNHVLGAEHMVKSIRKEFPQVPIIARASDEAHAVLLLKAGANIVVPETLESGLQLAGLALSHLGIPLETSNQLIDRERERRIVQFTNEL